MERSLDFIGYPTYSITSEGFVRDLRTGSLHSGYFAQGYRRITLVNPDGNKSFLVHRLVGLAFLEQIDGKMEIDHIDRNKQNNCLSNLRWANDYDQAINKGDNKSNTLKEKHITMDDKSYRVQVIRNKKRLIYSRFPTLELAIKARDEFILNNPQLFTD
jgi:hypothetical protein